MAMVMTTFLRITRPMVNQLTSLWYGASARDVINICDDTIYNLLAYVCDWSLGTHKILHPILSLQSGVTHMEIQEQYCFKLTKFSSFFLKKCEENNGRSEELVAQFLLPLLLQLLYHWAACHRCLLSLMIPMLHLLSTTRTYACLFSLFG